MSNVSIQIEISTDNAAFESCPDIEVYQIIKEAIDNVEFTGDEDRITLRDYNGNKVGFFDITWSG